jgi:hypothetical protein
MLLEINEDFDDDFLYDVTDLLDIEQWFYIGILSS